MAGIIFSEGSGLNNSVYGNVQAPIRALIESRGEAHMQNSILKRMFKFLDSDNFGELLTSMTGMDGFDPVGENGAYPADDMQEGFRKFVQAITWKDKFGISAEIIEDGKLLDLTSKPQAFMNAYERTREKFGAALYAGAFAGQKSVQYRGKKFDITTADGKSLFATDHPAKVKGKPQCNVFSDEFSVTALDYMESRMQDFRGDNEEILDVAPGTIVIANDPDLKRKVFAAIGADKDPDSAQNGFNYQFGRWNVFIWGYLNQFITAGTAPWMLMDEQYNEAYNGAVWIDRLQLAVKSTIDDETDANVWRGRSRFNAAFNDWRFAAVGGMANGQKLVG